MYSLWRALGGGRAPLTTFAWVRERCVEWGGGLEAKARSPKESELTLWDLGVSSHLRRPLRSELYLAKEKKRELAIPGFAKPHLRTRESWTEKWAWGVPESRSPLVPTRVGS